MDKALKYDQGKPDLTYPSIEVLIAVSRVREFGAAKYSRNNWKHGFKLLRSCSAALRHIFLFVAGETYDKESNLLHLAHAICCLEHAIYDFVHHPENDDREYCVDDMDLMKKIENKLNKPKKSVLPESMF